MRRAAPDTLDPKLNSHSKLGDITACIQAYTAGADEALMLDPHGFVATCNSTHFFIVAGPAEAPEVLTSDGRYCLGGITRANVLEICRAQGIPARETSHPGLRPRPVTHRARGSGEREEGAGSGTKRRLETSGHGRHCRPVIGGSRRRAGVWAWPMEGEGGQAARTERSGVGMQVSGQMRAMRAVGAGSAPVAGARIVAITLMRPALSAHRAIVVPRPVPETTPVLDSQGSMCLTPGQPAAECGRVLEEGLDHDRSPAR